MSLSEQIIGLCDPTPNSRTLDWFDDDDNDETKAKLCNYSENDTHNEGLTKSTLRKNRFETDPKYAGKPVSRKALGKQWGLNTSTRKGEILFTEGTLILFWQHCLLRDLYNTY